MEFRLEKALMRIYARLNEQTAHLSWQVMFFRAYMWQQTRSTCVYTGRGTVLAFAVPVTSYKVTGWRRPTCASQ